jgi:5-methylcytosine-specific restriction protein B
MFDHSKLADVLVAYKQNFVAKQWGDEKYKWEAVKWFQDNWDVNAADFAEMLSRSSGQDVQPAGLQQQLPERHDCWVRKSRSRRGPGNVHRSV